MTSTYSGYMSGWVTRCRMREALMLHYYDGMSEAQIAGAMGISTTAAVPASVRDTGDATFRCCRRALNRLSSINDE